MKKRFEYKSIEVKPKSMWTVKIDLEELEKQLNCLGMEGWELVAVTPYSSTGTSLGSLYTFKREL